MKKVVLIGDWNTFGMGIDEDIAEFLRGAPEAYFTALKGYPVLQAATGRDDVAAIVIQDRMPLYYPTRDEEMTVEHVQLQAIFKDIATADRGQRLLDTFRRANPEQRVFLFSTTPECTRLTPAQAEQVNGIITFAETEGGFVILRPDTLKPISA